MKNYTQKQAMREKNWKLEQKNIYQCEEFNFSFKEAGIHKSASVQSSMFKSPLWLFYFHYANCNLFSSFLSWRMTYFGWQHLWKGFSFCFGKLAVCPLCRMRCTGCLWPTGHMLAHWCSRTSQQPWGWIWGKRRISHCPVGTVRAPCSPPAHRKRIILSHCRTETFPIAITYHIQKLLRQSKEKPAFFIYECVLGRVCMFGKWQRRKTSLTGKDRVELSKERMSMGHWDQGWGMETCQTQEKENKVSGMSPRGISLQSHSCMPSALGTRPSSENSDSLDSIAPSVVGYKQQFG